MIHGQRGALRSLRSLRIGRLNGERSNAVNAVIRGRDHAYENAYYTYAFHRVFAAGRRPARTGRFVAVIREARTSRQGPWLTASPVSLTPRRNVGRAGTGRPVARPGDPDGAPPLPSVARPMALSLPRLRPPKGRPG
jgi:hypothetical protein